jgi:hypothetical protein
MVSVRIVDHEHRIVQYSRTTAGGNRHHFPSGSVYPEPNCRTSATDRGGGELSVPTELRQLPLSHLARACEDETAGFLCRQPCDDGFCLELFRRAIVERDGLAWVKIVAQYRRVVLAWIGRHPRFSALDPNEDSDHRVDAVFARFWNALKPERFGQFQGVRCLLAYLKMCVNSVVQDELRQRSRYVATVRLESIVKTDVGTEGRPRPALVARDGADDRLLAGELLTTIRHELRDDLEWEGFRLTVVLGLTPREIIRRYPDRFPTVDVVYQMKRKALDRLRQSPEIRKHLVSEG